MVSKEKFLKDKLYFTKATFSIDFCPPWLSVDVDDDVVGVDGGGDVLAGVAVRRVRDDQRRLPHRTVPQEHALDLVLEVGSVSHHS